MMKNLKRKMRRLLRGETIIEVLIALLVVTIGSATATSMILSSLKATQFNKDSLLALNLAQEGVEVMRNFRDSNWLKFSSNPQGCWNTKPNVGSCSGNVLLATDGSHEYALGLNASGNFDLNYLTAKLDLSGGVIGTDAPYQMNYYDLKNVVATNKDYIGSGAANPAKFVASTQFYRSIDVKYYTINTSDWTTSAAASPDVADMMQVTSTVQWLDAGQVRQVALSTALTRYK